MDEGNMKLFVIIQQRKRLPEINTLVETMWAPCISFSKAGNAKHFKHCTSLALCWDKWIDDDKWNSHPKSKEYIYFHIPKVVNKYSPLSIEIANDALDVDRRAFYLAAYCIAKTSDGMISYDMTEWQSPTDFYKNHMELLGRSFEDTVDSSLKFSDM